MSEHISHKCKCSTKILKVQLFKLNTTLVVRENSVHMDRIGLYTKNTKSTISSKTSIRNLYTIWQHYGPQIQYNTMSNKKTFSHTLWTELTKFVYYHKKAK